MTVSFFEWVQNLQNLRWEESEVNARLVRELPPPTPRRLLIGLPKDGSSMYEPQSTASGEPMLATLGHYM